MKDIGKIITKEIFAHSFLILKDYISERGDDIQDINLRLVSEYLKSLTKDQVDKYYSKYIKTGLVYSLPEFYSSDLVTIPKGIADIREYRFFSTFGLILYNSLGIFFADTCSSMLGNLNLQNRNIYGFTPTKYHYTDNKWKINNKWQQEYDKFKDRILDKAGESEVVLSLDISNFFMSINHKKLISIINELIGAHLRKKYSFDSASEDILAYYLLSMIGDTVGLPQGKKNFASDYLAYLYISKLDMEIERLTSSKILKFLAMVRYVDDIHIFFNPKHNLSNKDIYQELGRIEHSISKWLYNHLGLSINDKKTSRRIISDLSKKKLFVKSVHKKTSRSPDAEINNVPIDTKINRLIEAINTFKYPTGTEFVDGIGDNERENLKLVFEKDVRNKLMTSLNISRIKKTLTEINLELSASQFNIFGSLFTLKNSKSTIYNKIIIDYLRLNFNPEDKRHIHIMLLSSVMINGGSIYKNIIKQNARKLVTDDYGKYLLLYFFTKPVSIDDDFWSVKNRVFIRICHERRNSLKNFPYISKKIDHSFSSILFLKNDSKLDSVYTALAGYVHESISEQWSVAFNKLQMIIHESVKYLFDLKDTDKGADIIKILIKNGLIMSVYEERDFLNFWERRNFNPISHGSKNGLTSPEVTKDELMGWEIKVSALVTKIFKLQK